MAVSEKAEGRASGIIRPFGNLECYEFHMLQLRFLGNTIVSCRYTLPAALATADRHDDVVVRIEDAIVRVVLEHPALRIDVVNADSKRPAWVGVERVDFAHHVRWEESGGGANDGAEDTPEARLREVIERRLNEPEANLAKRPGWRVLVLHKRGGGPFLDVIFDYSHGLGDGTSGKIFHETLLRLLNTPTPTGPESPLANRVLTVPPTARPLPPAAEKLAKFPVSAKFALSTAWRELRPPVFSPAAAAQAHWAPIHATPYRTRFRSFDVSREDTTRVLAACRAHRTTLTGLLHALLLVCMAARVPAPAFTGSTALDLRRHLAATPDLDPRRTVADYVSQTAHEFDAELVRKVRGVGGDGDGPTVPARVAIMWSCAARVRSEIQRRLDRGLKNDLVGLMRLVPDWRAQFRAEAGKARVYSFVVSNLGVLDGESRDAESWGIAHSVFAISAEVVGAAFQVSPISVKGGALCVSCSWQDCVVEAALAEAVVADLELWLRFLGMP